MASLAPGSRVLGAVCGDSFIVVHFHPVQFDVRARGEAAWLHPGCIRMAFEPGGSLRMHPWLERTHGGAFRAAHDAMDAALRRAASDHDWVHPAGRWICDECDSWRGDDAVCRHDDLYDRRNAQPAN